MLTEDVLMGPIIMEADELIARGRMSRLSNPTSVTGVFIQIYAIFEEIENPKSDIYSSRHTMV